MNELLHRPYPPTLPLLPPSSSAFCLLPLSFLPLSLFYSSTCDSFCFLFTSSPTSYFLFLHLLYLLLPHFYFFLHFSSFSPSTLLHPLRLLLFFILHHLHLLLLPFLLLPSDPFSTFTSPSLFFSPPPPPSSLPLTSLFSSTVPHISDQLAGRSLGGPSPTSVALLPPSPTAADVIFRRHLPRLRSCFQRMVEQADAGLFWEEDRVDGAGGCEW